jgi:hypothetical protein
MFVSLSGIWFFVIGSEPESDVNATEEQYSSAEGQGKP